MPSYHIVFESKEEIYGILPQAHDWVHYSALLQVKDGGKFPVVLEMEFVPPHPYAFNLPEVRNRVGPQQLFDIDLNGSEVDL